jgi:hypothetical protein
MRRAGTPARRRRDDVGGASGAHDTTMRPCASPNSSAASGSSSCSSTSTPQRVVAGHGALGEADGEAALGGVVRAAQQAAGRSAPAPAPAAAARPRGRRRRVAGNEAVHDLQVLRTAELVRVAAEQDDGVALGLEHHRHVRSTSSSTPIMPTVGVG